MGDAVLQVDNRITPARIARFWERVDKSPDCWNWTGPRDKRGYGRANGPPYQHRSTMWLAHRLAWFLIHGSVPPQLNHHCDNPSCVRPSHVYAGTPQQNIDDAWARGRAYTKVSREQVEDIRRTYAAGGITQRALARRYGVTQAQIHHIVARKQRTTR